MDKKDHCSMFPEYIYGVYIGDCCAIHDESCSSTKFYKCLITKIDIVTAALITAGGYLGCLIKGYK